MSSIQINMEQHIVLEGLPSTVGPAQKDKFRTVLQSTITKVVGHDNYVLRLIDGVDGFVAAAFVDFKTVTQADTAVARLHKYTFTKTSELKAYRWSDFDAYLKTPETYQAPVEATEEDGGASSIDMTNTFMMDTRARPQLVVKGGEKYDVNLYWLNTARNATDLIRGPSTNDFCKTWSEMDVRAKKLLPGLPTPMPMWSPLGSYLLTQHTNGIKFWGGKLMGEVAHIALSEVSKIYVSPNENYFVSYASDLFQFWHIAENRQIKEFKMEAGLDWPSFKYNCNDALAGVISKSSRSGTSHINLFHAPTMRRLVNAADPEGRYTIAVEGLTAFEWSPTNPDIFAYVVAGDESTGHRVHIERIDYDGEGDVLSFSTMLRRNVYQATQIDLLWHPEGTFLATKATTSRGTQEFTICRVGASMASAEKLEFKPIDGKQTDPLRFAFQPNASRFAVIQQQRGSEAENLRKWVVFYSIEKVGFKEVGSYKTEGHRLHWAPRGARCVVSNFERSGIEFFGVPDAMSPTTPATAPFTLIAAGTHHMVTNVAWDPTGRFFCSFTSSLEQQTDHLYKIWNVNGVQIMSEKVQKLSHVIWRPLAKTVLTAQQVTDLKKNLLRNSERYLEEQLSEQRKVEAAAQKRKDDAEAKYKKIMDSIRAHAETHKWTETREEQIESAPAWKMQQKYLAAQPLVPAAAAAASA
jgi:translation initiation factor 3 subunit B